MYRYLILLFLALACTFKATVYTPTPDASQEATGTDANHDSEAGGDSGSGSDGAPDSKIQSACATGQVCADDSDCDQGERCNLTLPVPGCQHLYCSAAGEPCDDDALCIPGLACVGTDAPKCAICDCDDGDATTEDACVRETGECWHVSLALGDETGLLWQNTGTLTAGSLFDAEDACDRMSLLGLTWRLPIIDELRGMIRGCPATETGGACGITGQCLSLEACMTDACDGCEVWKGPAHGHYMPSEVEVVPTGYRRIWSSSPYEAESGTWANWVVDFGTGAVSAASVYVQGGVPQAYGWCVSDAGQ